MEIKPFPHIFFNNSEKDALLYSFLICHGGVMLFLLLYVQHNADYVAAADLGGFFHIISRIFSIR